MGQTDADGDKQITLFPAGTAGDTFYVVIDKSSLKALGVSKADELVGKTVRVRGQVEATSRPVRPNTTGRIIVWELNQIELVKSKTDGKTGKQERKVLTPEEAIKQRAKEKVTVQFKVSSVEEIATGGVIPVGSKVSRLWVRLRDGEKFSVQLRGRVTFQIERLGLEPAKYFNDKTIRATGQLQSFENAGTFQIVLDDLDQIEVVR